MTMEAKGEEQVSSDPSWISVSPSGLWKVHRRWKEERKRGDDTPLLGSICKIRVRLKNHTSENTQPLSSDEPVSAVSAVCSVQVAEYPRSQDSVLQVPLDTWMLLRIGDGQCDIIESCLEGMKAKEMCEFTVTPHQQHLKMAPSETPVAQLQKTADESETKSESFSLQLHSFTPGKESWQMLPTEKLTWVLSHKQRGSQRFNTGDIWGAMHSYCCAVKLLISLKGHTKDKDLVSNVDGSSKRSDLNVETEAKSTNMLTEEEYKTMKAELHCNLSLCQLKLSQPAKAKDSSSKATALDPANFKAWYRLGQACMQLEDFPEARQAFCKVLELQPGSVSAQNALKQVTAKAKAFDSKLGQRLSKMFT